MEKETIEEFALRNSKYTNHSNINTQKQEAIILGAKFQAERSFNNEEVIKIIQECKSYLSFGDEFDEIKWFEQFKKK
jgi:hypothetical protein